MKNKEYKSFLEDDGSSTYQPTPQGGKAKGSVLSRQTKLIVMLAAFIVVMLPVYIFFVLPMLEEASSNPSTVPAKTYELKYSEELHSNGKLAMMPTVTENELSRVDIKNVVKERNSDGEFVSSYREWGIFVGKSGSWAIDGYSAISYDATALITILATFINMEVNEKLEFNSFDEIDLAAFGFDEESMPSMYTVSLKDGKKYTVTRGNKTPTGTGYYAYFTDANGEKRPTVYIIGAYYASLIGCSMYDLVSPVVIQLLDQKDYVPESFSIYRGKNQYFNIKKFTESELVESESGKVSHLYTEIDGVKYEYDASAYYSVLLYETIQPGIDGNKVVYAKPDSEKDVPKDVLLAYGIDTDNPYRQLFFRAKAVYATGASHMTDQMLVFSSKTVNDEGDSVYYVFNVAYNTIVEVAESAISFIEKDYTEFCEKYIFLYPFYNIDEITVDSTKLPEAYVQSGMKQLIETFILKSSEDYKLVDAIIKSTGKTVPDVLSANRTGLKNFGEWYSVLLSLSTQTDIPTGVLDKIDLSKPDVTITLKTVGGKIHTMNFYLYNSRHAYYTFDGLGRAYVKYDDITNMLDSTYKLINGREVNAGYTAAPEPTVEPDGTVVPPATTDLPENGSSALLTALIVVLVIVVVAGGGVTAWIVIKNRKKKA